MERSYILRNGKRVKFRIRTPKTLWDCLPKIIARDLKSEYQKQAELRCFACGKRIRDLFERACKGMVARTILNELVNEICNEELYRSLQVPVVIEPARPIPSNGELLQGFLGQLLHSLNITLNLPKPVQAETIPTAPLPVHTLKETVDLYLKEKQGNSTFNPKTEKDRTNSLSLLIEYLGEDFDLAKLNRSVMIDIRANLLKRYPKNRRKLYPDLPLKEVLKLKNVKGYVSETTMTRYLEFWNGFFNWAVQADYMIKNPAFGLSDRSEFYDVRELRPPFTMAELTAIFRMIADLPNRPRFMEKLYPMRYWVNLIALYQGMRLNEICQLYLDDIRMEEGIPCLRIRPDRERMQKVKNKSSIRTIPIHSILLRLGFMEYCQETREKTGTLSAMLFPPATALDGGYQRKMQQFNALIHALPEVDQRKSIHSYRHNFDTELINKGALEYHILCLDGHTRSGELMSRYAKPDMHKLQQTIELVTYNGFDVCACLNKTPLADEVVANQCKVFFLT